MTPETLAAAAELHRPVGMDKWGHETNDPQAVSPRYGYRCRECREAVPATGCLTWRTANGDAR